MRILFLDDNHERHRCFRKKAKNHTVDRAYTYDEATQYISKFTYDLIYLDHDLAPMDANYNYNPNERTGYDVAKFLSQVEHNFGKIVFVHSLNPSGRENIKSVLTTSFRVYLPEDLRAAMLWTIDVEELLARIPTK